MSGSFPSRKLPAGLLVSVIMAAAAPALAQDGDSGLGLEALYGDEEFISIATGKPQRASRAPVVGSVITAGEIKAMGATDLSQVLEAVPGLHVSVAPFGYNPVISIRGIRSQYNPEVLVLVNGIPITNLYHNDRNLIWGGMPVNSIARIEVIRGPGSALYGADALAGVINIITKEKGDIDGTEIGFRGGSFDTGEAWLLHGGEFGAIDVAASLEIGKTDGHDETMYSDMQSLWDRVFRTTASLAPGEVNTGVDRVDGRLDFSTGNWKLRFGYQGRRNVESGAGVAASLDPQGQYRSDRFSTDVTYRNSEFSEDWDVEMRLSYLGVTQENETPLLIFPGGAGFGLDPDTRLPRNFGAAGVLGAPDVYERHYRAEFSSYYQGFEDHRIRLGTGFYLGDLYRVEESKNFASSSDALPAPLVTGLIDVSKTAAVYLSEKDRKDFYLYLQDEWSFAPDWDLTAGVRYDDYSDFGETINPRVALVWATDYDLTTKAMYGRAFRAPSFAELYLLNNPAALGNSRLEPETIDTIELGWDYHPLSDWRGSLNLYRFQMDEIIQFVANTATNGGSRKGYGLELEGKWKVSGMVELNGNYAYQRVKNANDGSDAGDYPHHQFYLSGLWRLDPEWSLTGKVSWIGEQRRAAGDSRKSVDDYSLVDMTARYEPLGSSAEIAVGVHNLFDHQAHEPSPAAPGLVPGFVLDDLPLAGRMLFVEGRFQF